MSFFYLDEYMQYLSYYILNVIFIFSSPLTINHHALQTKT